MDKVQAMLEGDFDPDKFDAAMSQAFDSAYYDDDADEAMRDIVGDELVNEAAEAIPDGPESFQ